MNPNQANAPVTQLPADYDGVFGFTYWTDRDFTAKWGGIEYTFPALKTTPMLLPFSPLEIQSIRKKFAKELAEREFFQGKKIKDLDKKNEGVNFQGAVTYTENDLTPFIQKALSPLPVGQMKAEQVLTEGEKRPKAKVTKIVKTKLSGDDEEETLVQGKGDVIQG